MTNNSSSSSFIFNTIFDTEQLEALYENDYQYIEEIFATTLGQLPADLEQIQQAYKAEDLTYLKKAIHKVKPAFGFVGLTEIQEFCQKCENNCIEVSSVHELVPDFSELWTKLIVSKEMLEEEYQRLKAFNNP